jgi:hypothetical protein
MIPIEATKGAFEWETLGQLMKHTPSIEARCLVMKAAAGELKKVQCPPRTETFPGMIFDANGVRHYQRHRLDLACMAAEGSGLLTATLVWLDANKQEISRTDALDIVPQSTLMTYASLILEQPAGCSFIAFRLSFRGGLPAGGICLLSEPGIVQMGA